MTTHKSKGLGKGLGALFEEVDVHMENRTEPKQGQPTGEGILFISIHDIKPNRGQPRQHFAEEAINELADSIKEHGVLQPILVRPARLGYEIVAGERRWRAARKAGLKEIPCMIKELSDEQNLLIALIENMQREDLNPIEEAVGIDKMLATYGMTQETVARSIGKSRPYISNAVRLLKLPEEIKALVISRELSTGHARAIAGMEDSAKQVEIARKCVAESWSVREIERYFQDDGNGRERKKSRPNRIRQDLKRVEEELRQKLGTKVRIVPGIKKSRIEIEYYSVEELENLVSLIGRD